MTGFILSPAAQRDIADIWDYTVEHWGEAQAERYVLALRDACRDLATGRKASRDADDIRAGYRKLLVGSHVIFFRRTDQGLLDIVRVLHQHMDLPGRL